MNLSFWLFASLLVRHLQNFSRRRVNCDFWMEKTDGEASLSRRMGRAVAKTQILSRGRKRADPFQPGFSSARHREHERGDSGGILGDALRRGRFRQSTFLRSLFFLYTGRERNSFSESQTWRCELSWKIEYHLR